MSKVSLLALPIEILHRILDNLDVQTIFLALGNVCEQFRTIVLNYEFYKLNFTTISKGDFHRVRRAIRQKNVLSLTISDGYRTPGQIPLFLSFFRLNRFTRLRSLTLLNVARTDLNAFLFLVMKCPLISLTIHTRIEDNNSWHSDNLRLSPILSHSYLRTLDIDMWDSNIEQLEWPLDCTITNLKITHVSSKHIFKILCNCSHLQTLTLQHCTTRNLDQLINEYTCLVPSQHLRTLVLEHNGMNMNKLELLLSLLPSLTHLRIIDDVIFPDLIFDGLQWESLICEKLPILKRFEFFIRPTTNIDHQCVDMTSLIVPFKTLFWLKEKQWLINCDYVINIHRFVIYSVPICQTSLQYISNSNKISYSNYITLDNDLLMMNNINFLCINLNQITPIEKDKLMLTSLFHNVTELNIQVDDEWPTDSYWFLSKLIDLSRLEKISLNVNFTHPSVSNTITSIRHLLSHVPHLQSLSVSDYWSDNHYTTTIENICSFVPSNITHLQVKVNGIDEIKMIIKKFEHLSSVTFCIVRRDSPINQIIEWLEIEGRRPTFWHSQFLFHIWLNKHYTNLT